MEGAGFTVLRRGWPDFLCVGPDGSVSAVEVKSGFDQPSQAQHAIHAVLASLGIPVYVARAPVTASQSVGHLATKWSGEVGSTPASPTIPASRWVKHEDFEEGEW